MAHAERCPVCNGEGQIGDNMYGGSGTITLKKTCHGCNGKGWIEVSDNETLPPMDVTYVTNNNEV